MMTLADAIRLGALIRPQTFGSLFSDGGSCAYGAALEAAGVHEYDDAEKTFFFVPSDVGIQWRMSARVQCPLCADRGGRFIILTHLNDDHRLTREQIADYVEQWDREAKPVEQVCGVGR